MNTTKRLAVIVSGWHFPLHFFKAIAEQKIPEGWSVDLFCVAHRDPHHSAIEKKEYLAGLEWSYPEVLDRILYEKIATIEEIEALGWNYKLYPNTVGDFGNTNQWLEEHDYTQYDMLFISHDDNLILNDRFYLDHLTDKEDWMILTNSTGSALNWREFIKVRILGRAMNIRGSFEFLKPELFTLLGGKFDLSGVSLDRTGEVHADTSMKTLNNWNMVTEPFRRFLDEHKLAKKIKTLSNTYRVSDYCIEGERGFVSSIQKEDWSLVVRGLRRIQHVYAKKSKKR